MHPIELFCDRCGCCFACPEDAPSANAWQRIVDEGPWFALGDGATVEDRLFADLGGPDAPTCPHCGAAVSWNEEHLGQLSQQLLEQW